MRPNQLHALHALELDLRVDLESRRILEVALVGGERFDTRPTRRNQLLALDRLGESLADQVVDDFLADLMP